MLYTHILRDDYYYYSLLSPARKGVLRRLSDCSKDVTSLCLVAGPISVQCGGKQFRSVGGIDLA